MKKKLLLWFLIVIFIIGLVSCTAQPQTTNTPLAFPTFSASPPPFSPTPYVQTQDMGLPGTTPVPPTRTTDPASPYVILPGEPSGPYAVIGVSMGDVLNLRLSPGRNEPVVGTYDATATGVRRSGPSAWRGDVLWVEVDNPAGGVGWVNAYYLTEFVDRHTFCADSQVSDLVDDLESALATLDGEKLASLVSPNHGVDIWLWRYGSAINYTRTFAEWVFISTYVHNWGPAPGSGKDTVGSFHDVVLPALQEVFSAEYVKTCNEPGNAAVFSVKPWPHEYSNVNYINLYKPGTDQYGGMDWRIWLVGLEYVQGEPYLFSLINYQWEP